MLFVHFLGTTIDYIAPWGECTHKMSDYLLVQDCDCNLKQIIYFLTYLYVGWLSSLPVFLSWQFLQRLCQLLLSQNNLLSPLCGLIWSTTVAWTYFPFLLQISHRGCSLRYALLDVLHLLPYPRFVAERVTSGWHDICSSQYLPSVKFAQPGCLHGFFGLYGIFFPPTKKGRSV